MYNIVAGREATNVVCQLWALLNLIRALQPPEHSDNK